MSISAVDTLPDKQTVRRRAERLGELFRRQQRRGLFSGGTMVVRSRGEIVVEQAIGTVRSSSASQGDALETVSPATHFQVMSVSKAVVAFAIALLEDRGLVDVDAPVARYFPAFAARGKGDITVLDMLTHRSGLLLESLVGRPELWMDWDGLVGAIADARPEHRRGTLAYEAYAFGWVLAEVVRRVTGRPLPEFLADELPGELTGLRFLDPTGPAARNEWVGRRRYWLGGLDLIQDFERVNNDIACRRALVPGAGLITTARTLTAFYEMLLAGGLAPGGRQLVRPEILRRYLVRQTAGRDRITGSFVVLGRGFALGWALPHVYGWWGSGSCYGHPGGFGHLAFADSRRGIAVAILTNAHRSMVDLVRRFAPLSQAARAL